MFEGHTWCVRACVCLRVTLGVRVHACVCVFEGHTWCVSVCV